MTEDETRGLMDLGLDESVRVLGMTLAEYAAQRGVHAQAVRGEYREMMRRGVGVMLPAVTRRQEDMDGGGDGTIKFCLPVGEMRGPGGAKELETESVIIPMTSFGGTRWYTLCVSSQVGCRMGCTFCETGRMGLLRNLSAGEIVRQRLMAMILREGAMGRSAVTAQGGGALGESSEHVHRGPYPGGHGTHNTSEDGGATRGRTGGRRYFADGIQNVVFMGMGEPLDNFENVVQAIRVLSEPMGMNFPLGQITVSTVGRIDGLRKLAGLGWVNLRVAISLNAANDRLRDELMPINRGMPLAELKRALLDYPLSPKGRFLIEYVLIKGVNDSAADARGVADFCAGLRCIVNVIPYNPQRFAAFETPAEETILAFMRELKGRGVFVKRRVTHGRELMGACGQLGNPEVRRHALKGCAHAQHNAMVP